jgi:hypothetical protein
MNDNSIALSAIEDFGAATLQDFDPASVVPGQRVSGNKKRQFVRFYNKKIVDMVSRIVGKNPTTNEVIRKFEPVEKQVEMVEIITPGDKNSVDDRVQDYHKREYWEQYTAFRKGKSAPIGKNIDQCEFISATIATELHYLGVHVVEQLASASDDLCAQVANGFDLREIARAFVSAEETIINPKIGAMKSQIEQSNATIEELQKQLAAMQAHLNMPKLESPEETESTGEIQRSPKILKGKK